MNTYQPTVRALSYSAHTTTLGETMKRYALTVLAGAITAVALVAPASPATAAPAKADREVVVNVVDHTAGTWPLRKVVRAWSRMDGVRLRFAADCSDTRRYCVVVDAYDHGTSGWMGLTSYLTPRIAHVQLNTTAAYSYAAGTRAQRQAIACHELAHTLGAPHPPASAGVWGCIANSDHDHSTALPTRADRQLVRQSMRRPWLTAGAFRYAWQVR